MLKSKSISIIICLFQAQVSYRLGSELVPGLVLPLSEPILSLPLPLSFPPVGLPPLFSLLLPLPLSFGEVGFDSCHCEGEGGLFDKVGPGSGGVPVSPQFLIAGSHGDNGVVVVPLFVEDFDGP